jgi:glycosyltransferase involved in cell wall biosynthesis
MAIVPSEYEGFGLPAGEAIACAVPVIAAAGGALHEVVGDAGIVVPIRNPAALAAAIRHLLESPHERSALGAKGRQRIVTAFNWSNAADQMTQIYYEVIKGNRGP